MKRLDAIAVSGQWSVVNSFRFEIWNLESGI